MRLIDADKLKEEFYNRKRTPDDMKYMRVPAEVVYQFIDNAPTVEHSLRFNVGDTVLIKGIVESINIETADNEPIYLVRIKGAGTYEAYGIRVKEDIMEGGTE